MLPTADLLSRTSHAEGTPLLTGDTSHLSRAIPGIKADLADAVKDFNEYVRKDKRVEVSVLPVRDGITWVNVL